MPLPECQIRANSDARFQIAYTPSRPAGWILKQLNSSANVGGTISQRVPARHREPARSGEAGGSAVNKGIRGKK
jgi:hypothetical protein